MKKKLILMLITSLALLLLLPVVAVAHPPLTAKDIAGSYDSVGLVTFRESSSSGFFASGGIPSFTLDLKSDGTGTATYNPSERLSVPMEAYYDNGIISAATTYITPSGEYVYYISFIAVPRHEEGEIIISGDIGLRVEHGSDYAYGEYTWTARKEASFLEEEWPDPDEDDIPVLTGPEQESGWPPDLDSILGLESLPGSAESTPDYSSFPHLVPGHGGNWVWDWGYDCGCEEEPWEKHTGPLATAVISVIAAVAAALGGSLGSSFGATAGAAAEALGAAGPEVASAGEPESAPENKEAAEEQKEEPPAGDYLPPEADYGGPDDNPYTTFQDGKGPGDCVKYGLPRYFVNTASLNLVISDVIFKHEGLGPEINLALSYNSASKQSGIFGRGWSFSYEWLLEQKGDKILIHKGSGQALSFTTSPGATPEAPIEAQAPAGVFHRLLDYQDYWFYIEKGSAFYQRFDRVPGMNLGRLTRISDYYGNRVNLHYNAQGTLSSVTDAAGRSIIFTYNEKNLCTGLALPDGRSASFVYDEKANLVRSEDLMGIVVHYEYDEHAALVKMVTGKEGRTVSFTYKKDGKRRLLQSFSDPNGNTTCYALLHGAPRQVEVTDPEGAKTIFQSSNDGLTEKVTDPLGQVAAIEYRGGLPVSHRDKNGGLMRWEYDKAGNQLKEIDQAGEELSFAYDRYGNLTSITDPLGGKWQYGYNKQHSLVGITSPAGRRMAIDYNKQGLPVNLTDFAGLKTSFAYDQFGNAVKVTSPAGGVTAFSYDEQGYLPVSVTDPLGHKSILEHDANGRLIRHRFPDGSEKSLVYDCCYSLLATDERGISQGFERDHCGNILQEIDAMRAVTKFTYDGNNNLTSLARSGKKKTLYRYDAARRLREVTNALGQKQLFSHDPAGNLASFQQEGGSETVFAYDPCHRKVKTTDPLGATTTLKRDPLGRVTEETGPSGRKVQFTYDADGLVEKVFYDGKEEALFAYDGGGRLRELSDTSGKVAYKYSEGGGLKEIAYPAGEALLATSNKASLIESLTYPGGLKVSYLYDNRLRPAKISWPGGWAKYSYDAAGNLTGEVRSNGTESIYEYDKAERLIKIEHSLKEELSIWRRYSRDALGSITEEEGSALLKPPLDEDFSVICNEAGQMAGPSTFSYDAAGNLLEAPKFKAAYDAESRLVELSQKEAKRRFYYNGLGHLVQEDSKEGSLYYGRDLQGNLMFESEKGAPPKRFYLYCHSRPVALVDEEKGTFFYHFDQGGNTLALTSSEGALATSYAYSAFGRCASSDDTVYNPFTFGGAYGVMDKKEGLYLMQRRFYAASFGRFLQKDPLGFAGGTNLYAYAANNPLSYIDPGGTVLLGAWITWKTVGMAVGVATSVYYTYKTAKSSYSTVSETKKSAQAMDKMNNAYKDYTKICDHYGQFGGWDAKEAAWQKYVRACHEFNEHKNAACQGALDTADNMTELGKNVLTPDALSLPVSIYEHATKGGGSVTDPCQGGRPVTATKGVIWQPRRHY